MLKDSNSNSNQWLQKIKAIPRSGPSLAALIVVIIVLWMIVGLLFSDDPVSKTIQAKDNSLTRVQVESLTAETITREISILGTTQFKRRVVIKALTDATVLKIDTVKGSTLSKSQVILSLDDRDAHAQFNHANALVKQRELEFKGSSSLADKQLISEAQLAESRSSLESAKAQMIQKQILFKASKVSAPFAGVLENVFVVQGDYVREGDKLAEVLDFSPFIIVGQLSEKEAHWIKLNQKAFATTLDGKEYEGRITYVSQSSEADSRSFLLELEINNKHNQKVLSGISASIRVPVEHNNAHRVASSVLEINGKGKFGVKTIDDNDVVLFKQVEIVKSDSSNVWVTGLSDEVKLITRGQGFVKAGETIIPSYVSTQAEDDNSLAKGDTSSDDHAEKYKANNNQAELSSQ